MKPRQLAFPFAMTVVMFYAAQAAAETQLGLDADWAFPGGDEHQVHEGGGFNLRLGRRLDLKALTLTGEVSGGYYAFGGDREPNVYRGLLGARLGLGSVLRGVVFAHGGVGRATFTLPAASELSLDRTAFAYDAGAALNLTLLPLIDVGAHVAYNAVARGNAPHQFDFTTLGINLELLL